jgi:hypothetical protein
MLELWKGESQNVFRTKLPKLKGYFVGQALDGLKFN